MNPGFENSSEYAKFRTLINKIKTVENLDGFDINDKSLIDMYKSQETSQVIKINTQQKMIEEDEYNEEVRDKFQEMNENDINNLIKQKKRQSTITYSQRMLKKADNLTKFNRKNHSEGNKHITNNDL
jgi:hypothetical protein